MILDISFNDLRTIPPELGLIKSLRKIVLEGNAIRSIRSAILNGSTDKLKDYLKSRIDQSQIGKFTIRTLYTYNHYTQVYCLSLLPIP